MYLARVLSLDRRLSNEHTNLVQKVVDYKCKRFAAPGPGLEVRELVAKVGEENKG